LVVTKPFPTSNWPFFFAPPIPTSLRRFAFETHGKTRAIGDMTSDITSFAIGDMMSFAIGDTKWFATGEGSTHLAQRFQNTGCEPEVAYKNAKKTIIRVAPRTMVG
jgi:hypothetical protein